LKRLVTADGAGYSTFLRETSALLLLVSGRSYSHRGFSPVSDGEDKNRKPFKRFPVLS